MYSPEELSYLDRHVDKEVRFYQKKAKSPLGIESECAHYSGLMLSAKAKRYKQLTKDELFEILDSLLEDDSDPNGVKWRIARRVRRVNM